MVDVLGVGNSGDVYSDVLGFGQKIGRGGDS
jgi:hypothetical protein